MKPENSHSSIDQQLDILAGAISDVGYWSWWTEKLPEIFQIEFGGTQLYFPPKNNHLPPESKIAVRFDNPTSINFLSRVKGDNFEWVRLLQEDQIEPPTCSHGEFSFGNTDLSKLLLQQTVHFKNIYGTEVTNSKFLLDPFSLVFWCGDIGLAIGSNELKCLNHTGNVALEDISELNKGWWQYWKLYWERIDTSKPLPKDYACEVTIPIKR